MLAVHPEASEKETYVSFLRPELFATLEMLQQKYNSQEQSHRTGTVSFPKATSLFLTSPQWKDS